MSRRAQLRRYLLPDVRQTDGMDEVADHFPRSKVMRFAFNPLNRQILMFSGSVLALLATRVVGREKLGLVAELARTFTRKKSLRIAECIMREFRWLLSADAPQLPS